jgi:hypothetical protein
MRQETLIVIKRCALAKEAADRARAAIETEFPPQPVAPMEAEAATELRSNLDELRRIAIVSGVAEGKGRSMAARRLREEEKQVAEAVADAIEAAVSFTVSFVELAVMRWPAEALRGSDNVEQVNAFEEAYNAIHKVLRATGHDAYNRVTELAESMEEYIQPYDTAIDSIINVGERLRVLYASAAAAMDFTFVPLLELIKCGGTLNVAPLKGLERVLEKSALRPKSRRGMGHVACSSGVRYNGPDLDGPLQTGGTAGKATDENRIIRCE